MSTTFTDSSVVLVLDNAVRRVNRELCLFNTTDEISVVSSGIISTDNGILADLVYLASQCIISTDFVTSEFSGSSDGLRVTDGEQTIDTTSRIDKRLGYLENPYGPCSEFRRQIVIEKLKRTNGYDVW